MSGNSEKNPTDDKLEDVNDESAATQSRDIVDQNVEDQRTVDDPLDRVAKTAERSLEAAKEVQRFYNMAKAVIMAKIAPTPQSIIEQEKTITDAITDAIIAAQNVVNEITNFKKNLDDELTVNFEDPELKKLNNCDTVVASERLRPTNINLNTEYDESNGIKGQFGTIHSAMKYIKKDKYDTGLELKIHSQMSKSSHLLIASHIVHAPQYTLLVLDLCYCTGKQYIAHRLQSEVRMSDSQMFQQFTLAVESLYRFLIDIILKPTDVVFKEVMNNLFKVLISDYGMCLETDVDGSVTFTDPMDQNGFTAAKVVDPATVFTKKADIFGLEATASYLQTLFNLFGDGKKNQAATIRNNKPRNINIFEPILKYLTTRMISGDPEQRPTDYELRSGLIFWNDFEDMSFITKVWEYYRTLADPKERRKTKSATKYLDERLQTKVKFKQPWFQSLSKPLREYLHDGYHKHDDKKGHYKAGEPINQYNGSSVGDLIKAVRHVMVHPFKCAFIHIDYFQKPESLWRPDWQPQPQALGETQGTSETHVQAEPQGQPQIQEQAVPQVMDTKAQNQIASEEEQRKREDQMDVLLHTTDEDKEKRRNMNTKQLIAENKSMYDKVYLKATGGVEFAWLADVIWKTGEKGEKEKKAFERKEKLIVVNAWLDKFRAEEDKKKLEENPHSHPLSWKAFTAEELGAIVNGVAPVVPQVMTQAATRGARGKRAKDLKMEKQRKREELMDFMHGTTEAARLAMSTPAWEEEKKDRYDNMYVVMMSGPSRAIAFDEKKLNTHERNLKRAKVNRWLDDLLAEADENPYGHPLSWKDFTAEDLGAIVNGVAPSLLCEVYDLVRNDPKAKRALLPGQ